MRSGSGTKRRGLVSASLAPVLVLLLAGCGDDDLASGGDAAAPTTAATSDETTTTTGGAGGEAGGGDDAARIEAYCELARQLDEQQSFPTVEQLEELIETAPDAIREDITFVAERFMEAENEQEMFALFGDPEIESRFEPIEAFEVEQCGMDPGEEEAEGVSREIDPDATRVDVVATEYDFDFEAPTAGAVSFVMANEGEEPHFMGIGKLQEGVTVEQAIQSDDPSEVTEWTAESEVAGPGEEAALTVENLEPGEYGMVCFVPAPDGQPHAFKGMAVQFTVE